MEEVDRDVMLAALWPPGSVSRLAHKRTGIAVSIYMYLQKTCLPRDGR
jgi:hypothetical protein